MAKQHTECGFSVVLWNVQYFSDTRTISHKTKPAGSHIYTYILSCDKHPSQNL